MEKQIDSKSRIPFQWPIFVAILLIVAGLYLSLSPKQSPRSELKEDGRIEKQPALYEEIMSLALPLEQPKGLTVDATGRILVLGDQRVLGYRPDHRWVQEIASVGSTEAIAMDEAGAIYLLSPEGIAVFDRNGNKQREWGLPGNMTTPISLAVGEGHVYIADMGNRAVWRSDKQGREPVQVRLPRGDHFVVPSPFFDLAVSNEGDLWVVNPGKRKIYRFTPDGDLKTAWGETSMTIEGFTGCCNPTHIAVADDGTVFTSEKGFVRVKAYDSRGVFQGVVADSSCFLPGTTGLDLAVDRQGNVYILDPKKKLVRVFAKKPLAGVEP